MHEEQRPDLDLPIQTPELEVVRIESNEPPPPPPFAEVDLPLPPAPVGTPAGVGDVRLPVREE